MSVWSEVRGRARTLFLRRRQETELDEEIQFHLERETETLARSGVEETAARKPSGRIDGAAVRRLDDSAA